jgi:hypothetical protein
MYIKLIAKPPRFKRKLRRLKIMNRSLLKFFLLVFALTVPVWLIGGMPLPGASNFPLTLNVLIQPFVPLIAALILVRKEEGRGSVRGLLMRTFDYRRIRNRKWYVPIIFLAPLIYLLTYGVMVLARIPSSGRDMGLVWSGSPLPLTTFRDLTRLDTPGDQGGVPRRS